MIYEILNKLKAELDAPRYQHTIGVMYTAASMAMAFGYSVERAMLAGILHDCAKCISDEEKIRLCKEHEVEISKAEYANISLLHAKAGAILAKTQYGVEDSEILHAIQVHTTGEPEMGLLDKIIYIADYIEPGRDKAPHLTEIRRLAFSDLNQCMAEILYDTLMYLNIRNGVIDPLTEQSYDFYKIYRKE
uniref:bis(5'-nucleosyl)-tetraphosphatase (symmetrical) YqeK n=1 Tax=Agathobacter sp. TaxID=2021311 RepID=UPI004056D3C3